MSGQVQSPVVEGQPNIGAGESGEGGLSSTGNARVKLGMRVMAL